MIKKILLFPVFFVLYNLALVAGLAYNIVVVPIRIMWIWCITVFYAYWKETDEETLEQVVIKTYRPRWLK